MRPSLTVPFTADELRARLKYDPDTGAFTNPRGRNPNRPLGTVTKKGYRMISVPGSSTADRATRRPHYAHRLAWMYVTGEWPGAATVDHENQNKDANWFSNLRLATYTDQRFNMKPMKNNRYGVGVRPARGSRWRARIQKRGQKFNLGTFKSQGEAALAYEAKRLELAGQFAPTS